MGKNAVEQKEILPIKELKEAEETKENMIEPKENKKNESVYSVEELAQGAKKIFHTMPECVIAALKNAHVTKCTVSKAKEIVEAFIRKEVK